MSINDNKRAIYNNQTSGPTFGDSNDIYIADKCNTNNNSTSNFPISFNYNGQYTKGQTSCTAFSGAVDGKNYKVEEYEVFKVIY
jgi:hypothetical protein